jgi:hypothetical protein
MREVKNFGMTRTINVIDAIPGAGKTSWAIQYMNESINEDKKLAFGDAGEKEKFIYVTPFLKEVDRIKENTNIDFVDPRAINGYDSKMKHLQALIVAGKSIVTTHALFKKLDLYTLNMIENAGYTLIMDEVANVLEQYDIKEDDFNVMLRDNMIEVKGDGTVIWLDENYCGDRFHDIKVLAEGENLIYINKVALFWTMNTRAFEAFENIYVLTYLFNGQTQCYYYKVNEIKFNKLSVSKHNDKYELIEHEPALEPRQELYDLLNIYEDYQKENGRKSTLNSNFDSREKLTDRQKRGQLSTSWFKQAPDNDLKQLKNNVNNYFRNVAPAENTDLYWTTKKSVATKLKNPKAKYNEKDDRTKDNFLPFNARATNEYGHCKSMAFVYNRFINPLERNFFANYNVAVDENLLAVSDLLQFIFRGCVRNNQPLNCYIPSERMRNLLKDWSEYKI